MDCSMEFAASTISYHNLQSYSEDNEYAYLDWLLCEVKAFT